MCPYSKLSRLKSRLFKQRFDHFQQFGANKRVVLSGGIPTTSAMKLLGTDDVRICSILYCAKHFREIMTNVSR